jgi:hypothetical protein
VNETVMNGKLTHCNSYSSIDPIFLASGALCDFPFNEEIAKCVYRETKARFCD